MLKAKNLLYVKQLLYILAKLVSCFASEKESKLMLWSDFIVTLDIFNINLFKLIRYIEKSKISHKLQSYSSSTAKNEAHDSSKESKPKGLSAFLNSISKKVNLPFRPKFQTHILFNRKIKRAMSKSPANQSKR